MKGRTFWLKAAAAIALTVVLALGAAVVALRTFLPEPVLRERVLSLARKQLGREVRLEGISLGLTGLSLRGLEVSESPDFKAGTFLKVETFHIRPSWRALLRKKLVVASVSADGLKVTVVKGSDGSFNYESLMSCAPAAPAAAPPPGAASVSAPEFNVHKARISRGLVEYHDAKEKAAWTVSDLSVALDDFSLTEPFGLDTEFHVRGKAGERVVDAGVAFAGTVDAAGGQRKQFKAKIKKLVLEQDGVKLTASGRVADLALPDLAFDLSLAASGKTLVTSQGTAKLGEGSAQVDLKAKSPGLDTRLLAKLMPGAGIPALDIPPVEATVAGRYAPGMVEVKTLNLSWSAGKVTGSGSAKGLGTAKPIFDGKASIAVDVPEIRPGQYPFLKLPPKAWVPAAHVEGEFALSADELKVVSLKTKTTQGVVAVVGTVRRLGSAKPVPDLKVTLGLDIPGFKISDLPVEVAALPASFALPSSRIDGGLRVAGDAVHLDALTLKAKDGSVKLDGLVAKALSGSPQPEVSVEASMSLPPLTDKDLPFAGVPAGLQAPASRWEALVDYSPKVVRVRKLRLETGKNIVSVEGSVSDPAGRAAFDLLVKCKSFVLDELTQLTPETRDLKVTGSGFFALSVTGHKLKPVYAGKLQFKDLGATVAGLSLSEFGGTVSMDERRIDVPNLRGKVADGTLQLDLTVKEYARAPEIQLEASLDRFDLAKYLTAKNKLAAGQPSAKAAKPASAPAAEKLQPIRASGKFDVGVLSYEDSKVEKVHMSWDLSDLTPDLKTLSGEAKVTAGAGKVHSVGAMATQSKLLKVMVFPLLIVQKLGRIGGIKLFPDFNDITLRQIVGDYGFKNGLMTLRQAEMDSDAAQVSAKGTINLPVELLDLVVTAQVANVAPVDVAVTGTFADPKTKVNLGKFLADPAKNLINNLLRKQ